MARTPLLRALRRAFADYRRATALGLSADAYRALRESGRLRVDSVAPDAGRRQLLARAAAALAVSPLAIGAPALAARPLRKTPRIAIVGAGMAGLTAALQLRDEGLMSTVYEASGRVGGRMFSNSSYWDQGQVSEWGGELIDTAHRTVRTLAKRFHLDMDDLLEAEPPSSAPLYWLDGGHYPRATAVEDFLPVFERLEADLAAAPFPTLYNEHGAAAIALDQLSVADWIASRVPGGLASPLGRLLDLAYATEYGAPCAEQSSLNLIYLLAYQPDPDNFTDFGESDERFHIRGGNQQLPVAIAAALGADSLRLQHALTRLTRTDSGDYRLDFAVAGGATATVLADLVVLAVPSAALDGVDFSAAGFGSRKREAMQSVGRGVSGKLQLQFDRRYWTQPGPWGLSSGATYADLGYQQTWDVSRGQPGSAGILNFYTTDPVTSAFATQGAFATANEASVRADAEHFLGLIEPVYPGISAHWNGKATQSIPHRSRYYGASYSYYRVGQYTRYAGVEAEVEGGVHFAGEHTSINFQGYMEGAAETGRRAAREILRRLR